MTADESGNNSTQFFSVLEDSTTETILNDITYDNLEIDDREFTLSNATAESTIGKQEELEEEIPEDQELIIFKSPHSSKLYGLQSTQDEEGNLLKYQYEVLQNEDGQFESIPGTIELVPYDTTPASVIRNIESLEAQEVGEALSQHDSIANNNENCDETENDQMNIKQEVEQQVADVYITGDTDVDAKLQFEYQEGQEQEQMVHENETSDSQRVAHQVFDGLCMNLEEEREGTQEDPLQDRYIPDCSIEYEEPFQTDQNEDNQGAENEDEETRVPVKQGILESALEGIYSPVKSENPMELYVHDEEDQPGDLEVEEPVVEEEEEDEQVIHFQKIQTQTRPGHRTIALYPIGKEVSKQVIATIELPCRSYPKLIVSDTGAPLKCLNSLKRSHGVSNSLVISPQKENLEVKSSSSIGVIKKNNVRRTLVKKTDISLENLVIEDNSTSTKQPERYKSERDKKKHPSWNVNKMISQTKIIEAPIRQERLPRKQKIKPLERLGEELVFQHVTVTANGVVETKVDGIVRDRKVLQPSECIHLSDNEDEFERKTRKRNSKRKQIQIVISDSEDESLETPKEDETPGKLDENKEEPEETSSDSNEKETNECPKCSKTFPSAGSLKTHLQFHTLEELKTIDSKEAKGKHVCSICSETFINAFLKNKHEQLHKARTRNECAVCKKLFKNSMALNVHQRSHAKDNSGQTSANSNVVKRRSLRSYDKSLQPKPAQFSSSRVTRNALNSNSNKVDSEKGKTQENKARLSHIVPRKTILAKRTSLIPTKTDSGRKSLMPPPATTRKPTLPTISTRRSILPSKMAPARSSMTTRASISNQTKPSTSTRLSISKMFKCLTCNRVFSNKILLDTHIIKNCVKSPRRPLRSQPTESIPSENNKLNITSASTSRNTSTRLSTNLIGRHQTRSHSTSMINENVSNMSLANFKSTSSLNLTIGENRKNSSSTKKMPLSARHRITTNAGIPAMGMRHSFLNFKRKLMEKDSDSEQETDSVFQ